MTTNKNVDELTNVEEFTQLEFIHYTRIIITKFNNRFISRHLKYGIFYQIKKKQFSLTDYLFRMVQSRNCFCEMFVVLPPELQMGNFNRRLMLGFRRTVCCIVTDGGGIAAVVANSFE